MLHRVEGAQALEQGFLAGRRPTGPSDGHPAGVPLLQHALGGRLEQGVTGDHEHLTTFLRDLAVRRHRELPRQPQAKPQRVGQLHEGLVLLLEDNPALRLDVAQEEAQTGLETHWESSSPSSRSFSLRLFR